MTGHRQMTGHFYYICKIYGQKYNRYTYRVGRQVQ